MVKRLLVLVLAAFVVVSAGCAVAPRHAAVLAPIMVSKSPLMVGDTQVGYSKVGEAQSEGILIVAFGDSTIKAAMEDGGIDRIHHVDTEELSVLGIYARHITRVYGE